MRFPLLLIPTKFNKKKEQNLFSLATLNIFGNRTFKYENPISFLN